MNPVVNDFSVRIATPNGTGSQTSNIVIHRALLRMGLAANAKNLFPSNIAGLPTWYQIRVSPGGWQTMAESWQILLPLNQATIGKDLRESAPGTVVIDNSDWKTAESAFEGFVRYPVPFDKLARGIDNAKLRPRLKNLIYVGVVAWLLDIPIKAVREALETVFPGKTEVVDLNESAAMIGHEYASENFTKQDPYTTESADQVGNRILVDGNEAAALGAIWGGVSVVAWYPITPASSLAENLEKHIEKIREKDSEGANRFVVVQAEDELAAVGMALGAGWAGARSMTSTSGPGISLMAENLGLGYFTEIPTVIYDVQRVGPSTGLPTRTQQSDMLQVAFHSHGDTRFPMLLPANPGEAFTMSCQAYDLAEKYQTPVVFMSDLDLGMNNWICDPLEEPSADFDRGKIASDEVIARLENWGRYRDVDGDGIPYRTIPGVTLHPDAAHLTRGSGHDEDANYSESPEVYSRNLDRLARKISGMVVDLPEPILKPGQGGMGLIAFGTTDWAVEEALADMESTPDYLRVRSFPFHQQVGEFLENHESVMVIEQNQQGQMAQLLSMEYPQLAGRIVSKTYYGGLPLSANFVREALQSASEVEAR
ncbi:MAG: 2-oxoacid:acceptor oxidoreductase subunit alpha [Planctomycetota bacterium]